MVDHSCDFEFFSKRCCCQAGRYKGNSPNQEQVPRSTQNPSSSGIDKAPNFCPNCGEKTNGANFCSNCGQKLI
ncbi:zinc ribbon domain-containing protein [Oceanobacillus sp. Castelsardo]|uniref:zinc ribbon domain-containing protein n=1 Tax=Oceanobacillus sp. Castelsardo TaxID=1851204 RepID=UPI0035107A96